MTKLSKNKTSEKSSKNVMKMPILIKYETKRIISHDDKIKFL